jgi:Leucine-rich repeat (LRR) protein
MEKRIVIFLANLIAVFATGQINFQYTDILSDSHGTFLKKIYITNSKFGYLGAEELCKSKGLNLFAIDSKETYNLFNNYMIKNPSLAGHAIWNPNIDGFWINGRRSDDGKWNAYKENEKVPVFSDQTLLGNTGEPCLSTIRRVDFILHPQRCSKYLPVICEHQYPVASTTTTLITTTPRAIVYDNQWCGSNCANAIKISNEALEKKIQDQTTQIQKQNEEINSLKNELSDSEKSIKSLKNGLESKIQNLYMQLSEKENQIRQLNLQVSKKELEDNNSNLKLNSCVEELKKVQTDCSLSAKRYQQQLTDLKNKSDGEKCSVDVGGIMSNMARAQMLLEYLVNYIKMYQVPIANWDIVIREYNEFASSLYILWDTQVYVKPANKSGEYNVIIPKVYNFPYPWVRLGGMTNIENSMPLDYSKIIGLKINDLPMKFILQGIGSVFPDLQTIIINKCELEIIQSSDLSGLTKLRELNLSQNYLKIIHNFVFNDLTRLEILDLSYNQIATIENNVFEKLVNLREIRLNNNLLITLEFNIFVTNSKLSTIYLQNNRLILVNNLLMEYFKTKHTDMRNNQCIDLVFPTSQEKAIQKYCVDPSVRVFCSFQNLDNVYTCVVQNLVIDNENYSVGGVYGQNLAGKTNQNVKGLKIVNQKMTNFPSDVDKFFKTIEELWIQNSGMRGIYDNDFKALEQLKKITITQNSLQTIQPGSFDNNLALEYLDLSANKITAIPEDLFRKHVNLQSINLNRNNIASINEKFIRKFNKINTFSINTNRLKNVSPMLISRLKDANFVDFTNNDCISSLIQRNVENSATYLELVGIAKCNCPSSNDLECIGGEDD